MARSRAGESIVSVKEERRTGVAGAGQAGGEEGDPRRRCPPGECPPQASLPLMRERWWAGTHQ